MAAAEKFKAPDVSTVSGAVPTTVPQPIPEESDEEVIYLFTVDFTHQVLDPSIWLHSVLY